MNFFSFIKFYFQEPVFLTAFTQSCWSFVWKTIMWFEIILFLVNVEVTKTVF